MFRGASFLGSVPSCMGVTQNHLPELPSTHLLEGRCGHGPRVKNSQGARRLLARAERAYSSAFPRVYLLRFQALNFHIVSVAHISILCVLFWLPSIC